MNTYFNVADFKAAFGINWRGAFWKTLMYIGVDHKITSLIEAMHDNVECAIVISGQLTERIKMEIVVRQLFVITYHVQFVHGGLHDQPEVFMQGVHARYQYQL